MKYKSIDSSLFIENRKKFVSKLKPNSIAIFHSNDEMPRSADLTHYFRQNADLFWLSGIDQEDSMLILYPECPKPEFREVLFLKKTSPLIEIWEGHKYSIEEAQKASGIKTIIWNEDFESTVNILMTYAENVYLNLNEHDRAKITVPYRDLRYANELKSRFPLHNYERSARILSALRALKNPEELKLIQEACNITEKAFRRVLKTVKPGMMEYEVEAEIFYEFIRNRATTYSYYPIIASGKSACVLHYVDNNKECKDGDVLLMDFGAEYANYAADMTRAIPVNGKFTPRQKDVYNAVLRVMKQATKLLKPGAILQDYNNEVGNIMEGELIKLGLLKAEDVKKQDPEKPLYKKYYTHRASHFMGLDVHDVGSHFLPIKAGMVFTCEPGIYIPEENLGIRLENDILVTDKEPIDLMANIPLEADEIEALMKG